MERVGQPLPDYILNQPKLDNEEKFLWRCFWELGTERPPSPDGVTPIPINSIARYAEWNSIPEFYFERYSYCIRQLDMHYVSVLNGEIQAARKRK